MKNKKKHSVFFCFLIIALSILFIYICNIDSIPDNIILLQGEKLGLKTNLGLSLNWKEEKSIEASSNIENSLSKKTGKIDLNLQLGKLKLKEVTVNIIPNKVVIPGGEAIGLKLYTNGVLVVGMTEIKSEDGEKYKPYDNTGIKEGDMITKVGEKEIHCTADLTEQVNLCNRRAAYNSVYKRRRRKKYQYFSYKNSRKRLQIRFMGKRCCGRSGNSELL